MIPSNPSRRLFSPDDPSPFDVLDDHDELAELFQRDREADIQREIAACEEEIADGAHTRRRADAFATFVEELAAEGRFEWMR